MNIAKFAIRRPIVIASFVILMMITGVISINRLGIDLFPDVEIPYVLVQTIYPGAGPEEIEEQISKPIEGEISSIAGVKTVSSRNLEGYSVVWAEFEYDVDIKYCEQQMRDKVGRIRKNFPEGVEEPVVERWNMDRDPVVRIALTGDLTDVKMYDLANEKMKPMFEQISDVGNVTISGGVRREIQIELDRNALNRIKISASQIAGKLKTGGVNVPLGTYDKGHEELTFRSVGKYNSLQEIEDAVIFFSGDMNNSVRLKSLGDVRDGTEDRKTMAYFYDKKASSDKIKNSEGELVPCIFLDIYKQSGTNTVRVADKVIKKIDDINKQNKLDGNDQKLTVVRDASKFIRMNVDDVKLSIFVGIFCAIIIVYLFLGNIRSTLITGIAIPNSLLGGFILMYAMGFTVNVMTLLALSLIVGLLIDDAIVVRENIFRNIENGMPPDEASETGTREVMMAVIATTITIIVVFMPVAFMTGIVGRFFKQFGLTIVFAMMVSLFDALAVAPLLSTYVSGKKHGKPNVVIRQFNKLQDRFDVWYEKIMHVSLNKPWLVIAISFVIFGLSLLSLKDVQQTFMPQTDDKEFKLTLELPSGYSLHGTKSEAEKIYKYLSQFPEVEKVAMLVGTTDGKSNRATMFITLIPPKDRKLTNAEIKTKLRDKMQQDFAYARPLIAEYSVSNNPFPFVFSIEGNNLDEMSVYADQLLVKLQGVKELTDPSIQYEGGKREYQINLNKDRMGNFGITPGIAGTELRYHIAGVTVGTISENGIDYDLRLRLKPEQRNIQQGYSSTFIPNINGMMVPLNTFSTLVEKSSPNVIVRENRKRIIQIYANIAPDAALGTAVKKVNHLVATEVKPPKGITTRISGENDQMIELVANIVFALVLAVIFIYFVLSSLYGSFITPFTILLALPPALSGAFLALFLTGKTLDIYSMIGLVMLMGLVTKNSILLVDFAVKGVQSGMTRKDAILQAGKLRLRPILMTTFALLAGTLPVALGIGEAAKGRMSMGISIIGGILLSTLLTLIVVPAIFTYLDIFREKIETPFSLKTVRARFGVIAAEVTTKGKSKSKSKKIK